MEEDSSSPATSSQSLLRPARPSRAAPILNRSSGRRGAPSALVRETAALQLEQRRADWAYSRPVVALDIAWNLAFAVVSAVTLFVTVDEKPVVPIRVWICGYAVQCVVHVALVWAEYRRRNRLMAEEEGEEDGGGRSNQRFSIVKSCESMNTVVSLFWWILGFYWVMSGGEFLLQDAPKLYWLTIIFLGFDVFFAIFCVALACVIGIALCCCLPCIIAILYAIVGHEGASDADINILPRYRYVEPCDNIENMSVEEGVMIPMTNNTESSSDERVLFREDAECCICLLSYEDGVELYSLPCNHHFHATCIAKWLRMNATCPLCKYNILKGNDNDFV